MPKYNNIACFTHSFTTHSLAAGDATRSIPLSNSSTTPRTASLYLESFNNSRLFHASRISSFMYDFVLDCENNELCPDTYRVVDRNEYSCQFLFFLSCYLELISNFY